MPFKMGVLLSVVVEGKLYVGGGLSIGGDKHTVMEYDCLSEKWATLPTYRTRYFSMAVISNQLVLVGGLEGGATSKVVCVWRVDRRTWTHPYPDMPTARYSCSAAVHNDWLVVAGGEASELSCLSSVELLNTNTNQWHTGPPLPRPLSEVQAATVGDMLYLMGGYTEGGPTDQVYSASIPTLTPHSDSSTTDERDAQVWKEIPGLQLIGYAPLSINGSLLAVGGLDEVKGRITTAIHLYQPDNGKWLKVGDLPSPRWKCTCAVNTHKQVLVAGGWDTNASTARMDIASFS